MMAIQLRKKVSFMIPSHLNQHKMENRSKKYAMDITNTGPQKSPHPTTTEGRKKNPPIPNTMKRKNPKFTNLKKPKTVTENPQFTPIPKAEKNQTHIKNRQKIPAFQPKHQKSKDHNKTPNQKMQNNSPKIPSTQHRTKSKTLTRSQSLPSSSPLCKTQLFFQNQRQRKKGLFQSAHLTPSSQNKLRHKPRQQRDLGICAV